MVPGVMVLGLWYRGNGGVMVGLWYANTGNLFVILLSV